MLSPEAMRNWLMDHGRKAFPPFEAELSAAERVLSRYSCGDLPSFARIALAAQGNPYSQIREFADEAARRVRLRRALRIPPAP